MSFSSPITLGRADCIRLADSVQEARAWMRRSADPAHDEDHAGSVAGTAMDLCDALHHPCPDLLMAAAWWHDVGRLFSHIHEELSAQIARCHLLGRGASEAAGDAIYEAIRFHKRSMTPRTLEGHIIRDADTLDFISMHRWEKCLNAEAIHHLELMAPRLPLLRGFLQTEESQALYDRRIALFLARLPRLALQTPKAERLISEVAAMQIPQPDNNDR